MQLSDTATSTSDWGELHSFVKLSIAYVGIVAGLVLLGLLFNVIAARSEVVNSAPLPAKEYYYTIAFFSILIIAPIIGIRLMLKRKRDGAYISFAVLALSVLAPYGPRGDFPIYPVYWFVIPNATIGILLALKTRTLALHESIR